jgi:hypothetical protein
MQVFHSPLVFFKSGGDARAAQRHGSRYTLIST